MIILGIIGGLIAIAFIVVIVLLLFQLKKNTGISDEVTQAMGREFPKLQKEALEMLVSMNNDKMEADRREIHSDLENKKNNIETIVKEVRTELERSNKKLEEAEKDRVGSFRALKEEIEQHRKITDQLSLTAEGLRKVLSNNQLRGQFGEQVAEDLLQMSGFVPGVDYEYNKSQEHSQTRPDFSVLLPNKVKINVDVKFPYANLQKITETKDEQLRHEYEQKFREDIRQKIKQVTTRNYINPEENTVDFVILFIPNEMIFSWIYDKMNDIWTEAMRQKVVFAGPFSFTAILRLVRQGYNNYRYQNNIHKIIAHFKTFEEEFEKYNEEFMKVGKKIDDVLQQYETVKSTRYNKVIRVVDKIKQEGEGTEPLLNVPVSPQIGK